MSRDSLEQARRLWAALARVTVAFPPSGGVTVVVSPESWLCPPAAHRDADVERLPPGHRDVRPLVASVDARDADESGMEEVASAVRVLREGRDVVAAAGYRPWLDTAAHLSVLVAAAHRGRGLARLVASAAVADALADGLLPQWRARPEPSRRVARALGFRELGSQISLLLKP